MPKKTADLLNKLNDILLRAFPGAELELEQAKPSPKIGGFLIWDRFAGKDNVDRQEKLWNVLEKNLTREDQLKITAILAVTPEELSVVRSE